MTFQDRERFGIRALEPWRLAGVQVDSGAFQHLVDGADGAHLAAHGAGALRCGRRRFAALARGCGIKGVAPHLVPIKLAPRLAHAVVHVSRTGDALGDVRCVRGDFGGNKAFEHVVRIGQTQVLCRRDVA